jgi:predicted GNAT family acetyltransferase
MEVSIYVLEDYRRQGLATALASNLLSWCLEHNLEPHWDAANPESCRLASKLGYKFMGSYEAHYLWIG